MFAAVVAGIVKPAIADEIPACSAPAGVEVRPFPMDLPTGLQQALSDKFGEIVPPGGKFNATDAFGPGRPTQQRRAIFVWQRGQKWIVASEHGGLGYNDPVWAFEVSSDGSSAKLMVERIAFPLTVCETATALVLEAE